MDALLDELVTATGVTIPLVARIMKVISESGASQIEISCALNMVGDLHQLLPVPNIADNLTAPPRGPRGA